MEESWFPAGQWTGQKAGSRTTPDPPLDAITADDSEGPEEAAAAAEKQADGVTNTSFLWVITLKPAHDFQTRQGKKAST